MKKNSLYTIFVSLLPALIFLAVLVLFYPYREAFQRDSDEGVNLMKAYMVHLGYPLYDEIWSDQPPLLTIAIRVLIDLFGNSVGLIRTLVLLVSSLTFLAVYHILRIRRGTAYAILGAVILFLHPTYVRLSTSIMVGAPAIAFAFLSMFFLLFWHRDRSYPALVLSAFALAISVGIKLFTGLLGVIIVGGLLLAEYVRTAGQAPSNRLRVVKPPVIWGLVFSAGVLSILIFIVGIENASQLAGSHLSGIALEQYQREEFTINYHLRNLLPTFFLAGIGTYLCVRAKDWYFLYFAIWSAVSYVSLLNHAPVWYHHQLLVSAPAAVLAAIAAGHMFKQLPEAAWKNGSFKLFLAILIGIILLFFDLRIPGFIRQFRLVPAGFPSTELALTTQEEILLGRVSALQSETSWFLTDLPIYAFRIGLPVPPDLAALTMKRFHSGELTEEEMIAAVFRYTPEQVLLGRTAYPQVEAALETDYVLIEQFGDRVRYYVRRDLAGSSP